jgi:hypothetical protein
MSFKDIAIPLAKLGIQVFPLSPGTKVPIKGMKFTREATDFLDVIERWDKDNPDCNVGMLATNDTVWFLEFDIPNGLRGMMAEMNVVDKPVTRAQKSGRNFTQLIFKHGPRSTIIGNRSVNLAEPCINTECEQAAHHMPKAPYCPYTSCELRTTVPHHHHEWFSVRAHNKYLVGAGSLHPNGRLYETAWDVEPAKAPDWVFDFIEKHSVPEPKPPRDVRPVNENFELDDLLDFYEIALFPSRADDPWKIVQACPGVDRMHDNSKRTGFYWDGESLGWHCFAQRCPTMEAFYEKVCTSKMGSLLHFLAEKAKEQGKEAYHGTIWGDDAYDGFEIADAEETDIGEVTQPEEPKEMCPATNCKCGLLHTPAPKLQPGQRMQECDECGKEYLTSTLSPGTACQECLEAEPPTNEEPKQSREPKKQAPRLTLMPPEAMYGWLGDFARSMGAPLGHAYTAALCIFAGQSVIDAGSIRGQLYGCLIAPKHEGKSRTIDRILDSMIYKFPRSIIRKYPGSEHGLVQSFGGKKKKAGDAEDYTVRPWLLALDELKWLLAKSAIKNSTLAFALNQLFYEDELGTSSKGVDMDCYPRMSVVGGLTCENPEDFSETFGKATESGTYDRFIFSVGERGWDWDDEWEAKPEMRFPKGPVYIPHDIFEMKKDWISSDRVGRGRLGEIALRIATITTSADQGMGDETGKIPVTRPCFEAALRYCEWQEAIRARYIPSQMDESDRDGKCQEAIVRAFRRYAPDGKYVRWRDIFRASGVAKHTAIRVTRIKDAMIKEGMLDVAKAEKSEKGGRAAMLIKLADDWGKE